MLGRSLTGPVHHLHHSFRGGGLSTRRDLFDCLLPELDSFPGELDKPTLKLGLDRWMRKLDSVSWEQDSLKLRIDRMRKLDTLTLKLDKLMQKLGRLMLKLDRLARTPNSLMWKLGTLMYRRCHCSGQHVV